MATLPLSGNLQPLSLSSSGKELPKPSGQTGLIAKPATEVAASATPEKADEARKLNAQQAATAAEKDGLGAAELQEQLDKFAQADLNINRSLRFKVDNDTGSTIIRVIDRQTDETIRQIPPEELLTLSKRLKELNEELSNVQGVLIRTEA